MVNRAAAYWNIFLPLVATTVLHEIRLLAAFVGITRVDKSRRELDRRGCCDSAIARFVFPFPWAVCFATDKKWDSSEFLCS